MLQLGLQHQQSYPVDEIQHTYATKVEYFYPHNNNNNNNNNNNSMALVHERTIPTEQPLLVGEVSASFCGYRGIAWSVQRIPRGRNHGF
jgi:hypothetical protein